jgi:formamidopyrimidine-DNA glycosylase
MPELPDIVVYIEAVQKRVVGERLQRLRIGNPFVLRSFEPPIEKFEGKAVVDVRRIGKRIAFGFDGDLWLVIHLMIAGRLHWKGLQAPLPKKYGLAALDFPHGTLLLTEAGSKRRASIHLVRGEAALAELDPGGLEILDATLDDFDRRLRSENHTLKRALTSPRLVSGIGNAYSDEILHAARLSPLAHTSRLKAGEVQRLYEATRSTLLTWVQRLRDETGDGFPANVTAFRPEMAVHGRFGKPCPVCGSPIQRIRYAENETNYCATCQTGGQVYADRSLSRLLKDDWPRRIEDWE